LKEILLPIKKYYLSRFFAIALKVRKYTARNFELKMFEFICKFKLTYIEILLDNQNSVLTIHKSNFNQRL